MFKSFDLFLIWNRYVFCVLGKSMHKMAEWFNSVETNFSADTLFTFELNLFHALYTYFHFIRFWIHTCFVNSCKTIDLNMSIQYGYIIEATISQWLEIVFFIPIWPSNKVTITDFTVYVLMINHMALINPQRVVADWSIWQFWHSIFTSFFLDFTYKMVTLLLGHIAMWQCRSLWDLHWHCKGCSI